MILVNCKTCGAPLNIDDEVCAYCGTITQHGIALREERKRLEQEEQHRHALDNLPKMKYVSSGFVIFMYIITLGCYSPYWYATRLPALNSLGQSRKILAAAIGFFALCWSVIFIVPGSEAAIGISEELSQEIYNYSLSIAFCLSIYIAFTVRSILQEYAAKFMDRDIAVGSVAPSAVNLVLFGPIYLQQCVNRMIKMKILAPQI